jgi:hypothetical protein
MLRHDPAKLDASVALATSRALPENVNYATATAGLISFAKVKRFTNIRTCHPK